jgi:hypothetical protein
VERREQAVERTDQISALRVEAKNELLQLLLRVDVVVKDELVITRLKM